MDSQKSFWFLVVLHISWSMTRLTSARSTSFLLCLRWNWNCMTCSRLKEVGSLLMQLVFWSRPVDSPSTCVSAYTAFSEYWVHSPTLANLLNLDQLVINRRSQYQLLSSSVWAWFAFSEKSSDQQYMVSACLTLKDATTSDVCCMFWRNSRPQFSALTPNSFH